MYFLSEFLHQISFQNFEHTVTTVELSRLKKKEWTFFSMNFSNFRKSIPFWMAPRFRPFVHVIRATRSWRWVWSVGGMMTGKNRSTARKTCPSATLSTTNLTLTGLGFEPGLCGERTATDRPNHGNDLNYMSWFRSYRAVNTPRHGYLTKYHIFR